MPSACIPCRNAGHKGICEFCGSETSYFGPNWRAPKKTDDKAWKRIAKGEIMWDREAVRKARYDENPYHKRWRQHMVWLERLRNNKYRKSRLTDS